MKQNVLKILVVLLLLALVPVSLAANIDDTFTSMINSFSSQDDIPLVVGDNVPAEDVMATVNLANLFQAEKGVIPRSLVAAQVTNIDSKDMILVGGPCANILWSRFSDETCQNWPYSAGQGIIKVVNRGSISILMIAGTTGQDTKDIVIQLKNGYKQLSDFDSDTYVMNGNYIPVTKGNPTCADGTELGFCNAQGKICKPAWDTNELILIQVPNCLSPVFQESAASTPVPQEAGVDVDPDQVDDVVSQLPESGFPAGIFG